MMDRDRGIASYFAATPDPLHVETKVPPRLMLRSHFMEARVDARSVEDQATEKLSARMAAYQAGDQEAFVEVYRQLSPALRRYLLTLTLDAAWAEDLVQETFLQMHRARRTYEPSRPVRPWAFGIARHVYLMERRSAWRRGRHEIENDSVDPPELPTQPAWERLAARDTVRRGLAELSSAARELLLLHHVWGFSFEEIGGMLGIRSGTARVRAHRAMKALRNILDRPRATLQEGSRVTNDGFSAQEQ